MKQLSTLILCTVLIASCTKDVHQQRNGYLQNVQTFLKTQMNAPDFNGLDFSRPVLTRVDSAGLYLLRIPLKGKALGSDFVLLKTSPEGRVEAGKIIHLDGKNTEYGEGAVKKRRFDGRISLWSLDRKTVVHSPVTNGFAEAWHGNNRPRTESLMPSTSSGENLPEVIVVASYSDYGVSYSNWSYLEKLLYNYGGESGSGGYYGSLEDGNIGDGGSGGGSGSSGDYGGDITLDTPMLIDYENQDGLDPIDIQKYINCFNAIPDEGSTCSIEIYADIPVDGKPNILFDFNSGSPGHTFLQLKKSNGTNSVIQNIGFYPKYGWKTVLTNAPIDGKFVDNGEHEYNGSFLMKLSPENLRSTLTEILYLANFIRYDIDNYNCTDFALDVFNKTRTDKIEIELFDVPGNYPSTGTRTPQGLYKKLKQMKDSNLPESSNISLSNFKCWVATSTGPCN